MAFARRLLRDVPGLRFHRLMGMGRGIGFSREPDWGRYAFLGVWQSHEHARRFLDDSRFISRYRSHAERVSTVILHPLTAHGSWDGANPFEPSAASFGDDIGPIGILTRATIRLSRAHAFWSQVAPVSHELAHAPGLIASVGIGELPFIRQATFSIWQSSAHMQAFAYANGRHREVIRRTRDEHWYSEDLFARFQVVEEIGSFP
jgi:hypothetical protein